MADNITFQTTLASPPSATVVSTEEVTTLNGGAVTAQQVQRTAIALRTADATAIDLPGDSTNGLDVDVTRVQGTVTAKEVRSSTYPFGTSIAGTVGNVMLLAANTSRMGASVYVEGGGALFLKMGSSAGTVDYSVQVPPGGYFEVPFHYVGTISGIWQFTGGTARIVEYL